MKKLIWAIYMLRLWVASKVLPRDLLVVNASVHDEVDRSVANLREYLWRSGHFRMAHKSHKRVRRSLDYIYGGIAASRDMVGVA